MPKTYLPTTVSEMKMLVRHPGQFDAAETARIITAGAEALEELMHRRYLATQALNWEDQDGKDGHIISSDRLRELEEIEDKARPT